MIGLLWAAVKFLAPAFGTAFASAAGTKFADLLIPEAVSANVAPAVVARASQRQATEDDQRVLQPVFANALSRKPDLAASLQSELDTAAPEIAKQARAIDAAVPPESEAARKFASGVISLDGFLDDFYSSLGFTDLQMTYWRDNVCPIGGEPTSVEYFDSLGNQTAMIRASPNPALTMDGRLVENVTIAKCRAGHSWRVFVPEA